MPVSVGECASHVVSKSAESVITAGISAVAAETAFATASSLLSSTAIPVIGPLLATGGTILATSRIVGELTDGVFDGIGDGVGELVEEIGDGICDTAEEICDGVSDVVEGISDAVADVFDGIGSFFEGLFW